jgi:hypothetical protein
VSAQEDEPTPGERYDQLHLDEAADAVENGFTEPHVFMQKPADEEPPCPWCEADMKWYFLKGRWVLECQDGACAEKQRRSA